MFGGVKVCFWVVFYSVSVYSGAGFLMVSVFDSLTVDGLSLNNRIVLPPMQTRKATTDGSVTESLKEHYAERATNVGLVIVEHSYISRQGKFAKNQLGIYKNELIPGLSELSETIQNQDTPAAIQITHAGKRVDNREVGSNPVAPSKTKNAKKLTKDEIEKIVNDFVAAAGRAVDAGFDAVEVHGAHGFLLNQFYSPLTNQREDEYGGSFEKRIKLPLEVVKKVRKKIGKKTLLYRLGAVDLDPEGIQINDSKKFAKKLTEAGVDILDVSGGLCGSRPEELVGKQGYFIPQAEEIKKTVNVPVIGVGGITYPQYAKKAIINGSVDLVAVGRAQLADPKWAEKAAEKLKK